MCFLTEGDSDKISRRAWWRVFGKVICLKFSLHCSDSRLSREQKKSGTSAKNYKTGVLQIWNCPRRLWASDSELCVRGISPLGRLQQRQIKEIYCCHLQMSFSLNILNYWSALCEYFLPVVLVVYVMGKPSALSDVKKGLEIPLFGERHILEVIW